MRSVRFYSYRKITKIISVKAHEDKENALNRNYIWYVLKTTCIQHVFLRKENYGFKTSTTNKTDTI